MSTGHWTRHAVIGKNIFGITRLTLEPLMESHAAGLFAVYSDPHLYGIIPQDPPMSLETLKERYRFLSARQSPRGDEGWFNWAIRRNVDGICIGCVQITVRNDDRAQIAYEIGVPYWRCGYATEACSRVIAAVFESGVREIVAELDTRTLLRYCGLSVSVLCADNCGRTTISSKDTGATNEHTRFGEGDRDPLGTIRKPNSRVYLLAAINDGRLQ